MAKWTFEQLAAINLRNTDLLVSAAAGSGKTAVLVERITQLISQREVSIDKMLIVTYTNAAASEMRARIESALSHAIELGKGDDVFFNDQIKRLNRASIKTFHAFCLDVIRNHFQKIECDPGFKMLGEPERTLYINEAMTTVLEAYFEKAHPQFIDLVEAFSGNRNDEKLIQLILQIFDFIQSQPHPQEWLKEQIEVFKSPEHPLRKIWIDHIMSTFKERLESALELLDEAIAICGQSGGPEPYIQTLESDQRGIMRLLELTHDSHLFGAAVAAFKFDRLATIKKQEREQFDEGLIESVKEDIRNRMVKKQVFEPIKQFFDYKSMSRYEGELEGLTQRIEMLSELTFAFMQHYKSLKKKRNMMDFSDLEHFTIEILEDPLIAESIKEKFEYLFVDEYQDASGIQEYIIQKIKRPNNLFMVGDVKQSIYKFRMADPELFIEKYKTFSKLTESVSLDALANESEWETLIQNISEQFKKENKHQTLRIDLSKNFRTRGEILNQVNQIFNQVMSEKLGDISYDAAARLYAGMPFEPSDQRPIEVNIISKTSLAHDEDDNASTEDDIEEIMRTEELEAHMIAMRIKDCIGTSIYDPKEKRFRTCQYKDIVVLIRSSKSWTPTFEQIFLESGIPLYADSRTGYFDALEIKLVLNLLRVIQNPRQDLAMLSVLRSPFVGLSIDEILTIKHVCSEVVHYDTKIQKLLETSEAYPELAHKLRNFVNRIQGFRERAIYMPLDEWIWHIIHDTGYYYYVTAMPGGITRQANLKLLVDRASAMKASKIISLNDFIEFIENMTLSSGDFGVASVLGEEDDVVRLMSIHKSKGLEFPVVILCGLGRKFNFMDAQGDLLMHKKLGLGLSHVDLTLRAKSKTLPQFAIRYQIKRETLSEEMRVLYVALTRPVDQLILFATVSDYNRKIKLWERGLNGLSLTGASCFMDWILPPLLQIDFEGLRVYEPSDIAVTAIESDQSIEDKLSYYRDCMKQPYEGSDEIYEEIHKRLSFKLPHLEKAYKPLKISVTDKKNDDEQRFKLPELYAAPKFLMAERPLQANEIGTAMHKVLEKISFEMSSDSKSVLAFLDDLCDKHFISLKEREALSPEAIQTVLASELGKRIRSAKHVYRETPFVLKKDGQFIQGIIDLYFEDEQGWVLVDYKTDRITPVNIVAIASRYSVQIALYKEAIESIIGKPVIQAMIYFVDANVLYHIHK